MDISTPPTCPNTVTIRRNPPRRARPTPMSSNPRGTTLFPNDEQQIHLTKSENKNLKVFLRIRPLPSPSQAPRPKAKTAWPKNPAKKPTAAGVNTLKNKSSDSCISIDDSQSVTLSVPSSMHESKRVKSETYGGFTHVFPSDSSQSQVYERMAKPMVDEFLNGRSGMLAALGPSGSGKTHTVFGSPRDPGMVPLTLRHIFKESEPNAKHASRSFYIAIFEIYSERGKAEKLFDLLPDGGELILQQSTLKGLKEVLISNAEQAESLIAQAVIKRSTAMTNMNSQSSRSQCIINIRDAPQKCKGVINPESNDAVLTIIDLAGAEREKRTGNQGKRLLESNFINNTLMVFSLCLRSLLEHQKNPKKPLQKHFQSSMLTRYLRDYLEGKKRMTLLLTAKPGEDDYLDTSYLLRQASPYMQIKYNEVERSNMVPKKRLFQASNVFDNAKQSPSLEHLKKMRLASEHTVQNDEKGVEECSTSKKEKSENNLNQTDGSTVSKLDACNSVCTMSERDSHSKSDRNNIIMRNFARVLWNVLKQYNSKMKVAEREIQCLKESIGNEKKKYLELEMQMNEFKAACTCCKGGKLKNDTEDSLSVDLDQSHNLDQQEGLYAESSSEPRLNQPDEEHILGTTTCVELHSQISDREVSVSSSEAGHQNSLEVVAVHKEAFCKESSSEPKLVQSDDEQIHATACTVSPSENSDEHKHGATCTKLDSESSLEIDAASKVLSEAFCKELSSEARLVQSDDEQMHAIACTESPSENSDEHKHGATCTKLDSENSAREILLSLSKPRLPNALEVDAMVKIPCEMFHTEVSPEPQHDQSNDEHMLGTTYTELDSYNSDRDVSLSLSKLGQSNALEVDAVCKIPSETFHPEASSETRPDQSDDEHMPCTTCTELDSEKSDREVSLKSGHYNALEVGAVSKETFQAVSSSESRPDLSDDEHVPDSTCTEFDCEESDREVSSKPGHHNALEADAVRKETFLTESSSEPKLDQSDDEHLPGTTCTIIYSETSKSALEIDAISKTPSEIFQAQSSSVPRRDLSNEEPLHGTSCAQLDPGKPDCLVLGVSSSLKPADHSALDVDSISKISNESFFSSSLIKEDILDPSSAKDVSSTKPESDIGGKPTRPKRMLVPSSSMLSRNLSNFDLFEESETLKGNRGSRKMAADDPKRSNGSISLLHLLHGRKSNTRL